jgi:hypothetical protein
MSRFATAALATALLATTAYVAGAMAQGSSSIPDFSSNGWKTANGTDFIRVPGSPPPVSNDPGHPYISNGIANRTGQQPNYRIGDLTNPNVKQWAKDVMKKDNDEILEGKIAFTPGQSCVPWGVPAVSLSGGPFFFVQTPKVVYLIEEGDRQARRIYMDVPHSANPKPSWYGESVGKYEGDTLVIDTIGLNTKTHVDNFRTPHTEKLHVVERYTVSDDGKSLSAIVTVNDPDTFNGPITLSKKWFRVDRPMEESVCAENNVDYFNQGLVPMPEAKQPDF